MDTSTLLGQLIGIGVWVFLFAAIIYAIVKNVKNKKLAATGEDLKMIQGMVSQFVPDPENYTCAYSVWTETEYHYRRTVYHYWYYAIAFNNDRIYIAPLKLDKGKLSVERSFCLEKSEVGVVNATEKNPRWLTFYDKDIKEIVSLEIEPKHSKSDNYHPVNIRQEKEVAAFENFVRTWLHDVNDPKGIQVTGKRGEPIKAVKKK